MPWCPKCGTEYRNGFAQCADCQVPLTNTPSAAQERGYTACDYLLDPVLAYQAATTVDGNMICEMLRNADIAAVTRDSGLGGISKTYTGSSIYGTDIIVDRSRLEDAREMLQIWASQDDRAPVSEEELARLALAEFSEDELAAQAEAEEPAVLVGNRSNTFMILMLVAIAVYAILPPLLVKLFS